MIPLRSEMLLPARVFRLRVSAANVAGNNLRAFAQFAQRPFEIDNCESATFPICDRVVCAKTIEIDRDVNLSAAEIGSEILEATAPVFRQDCTGTLSIFHRAIVSPGMNFKPAFAFGPTIGENIVRPPAFEISAAPNCDVLHMRQLERAIDPTAAAPFWRTNIPIRMIIKRNKNNRISQPAKPKRAQVMEVAGAIENKWRKPRLELAVERFNQTGRR